MFLSCIVLLAPSLDKPMEKNQSVLEPICPNQHQNMNLSDQLRPIGPWT